MLPPNTHLLSICHICEVRDFRFICILEILTYSRQNSSGPTNIPVDYVFNALWALRLWAVAWGSPYWGTLLPYGTKSVNGLTEMFPRTSLLDVQISEIVHKPHKSQQNSILKEPQQMQFKMVNAYCMVNGAGTARLPPHTACISNTNKFNVIWSIFSSNQFNFVKTT